MNKFQQSNDKFLSQELPWSEMLHAVYDENIFNIVYILQLTGLSSVKSRTPGRLGLWSLGYFTISSVIAVLVGIAVVVLIQPGRIPGQTAAPSSGDRKPISAVDAFLDLIRYLKKERKEKKKSSVLIVSNQWMYNGIFVFQESFSLKCGDGLF